MGGRFAHALLVGLNRRPSLKIKLGCLVVLIFAQALVGGLSVLALYRLNAETTADRVEVDVRRIAHAIEGGLRLGKPLEQFHGMGLLVDRGLASASGGLGILVTMASGEQVAARGEMISDAAIFVRAMAAPDAALARGQVRRPDGTIVALDRERVVVAVPLIDSASNTRGLVMLAVAPDVTKVQQFAARNLKVLLWVTLAVGVGLTVVFKCLGPNSWLISQERTRFLLPMMALLLAQGLYACYNVDTFRRDFQHITRDNSRIFAQGLQQDLNRLLSMGIPIERMRHVEALMARLASAFPLIQSIELANASGNVVRRADARGALPVTQSAPMTGELVVSIPFGAGPPDGGQLIIRLSDKVVSAGVQRRIFDALTVMVVALVAAVETLLLLTLLLREPHGAASGGKEVGRLVRPVMCGFVFAWALPLSFLPLYARSLPDGGLAMAPSLLLALPISIEMACGLATALIAGRMTDGRGWHVPTILGMIVSGMGLAACVWAPNLVWFTLARGLVGAGYGLTWMGLQGFIVTRSAPTYRGYNMSSAVAGLFAGHLTGGAIGAMLMEQLGFRTVFAMGVIALLLPMAGVLVLMRPYMQRPCARVPRLTRAFAGVADTLRLLLARDFGLLLVGSVIPFSIAQVGLLSYSLPLYLEAEGAAVSSSGRVLMIYGLCVIYLGPVLGRRADQSRIKKRWIVAGGIIGSLGLLSMHFHSGVIAISLAVLALAVAGCLTGASYAPYLLALPQAQRYGVGGSVSVMRAADKLGQMVGPMLLGLMFGSVGMGSSLAIVGLVYMTGTLLFLLFAQEGKPLILEPAVSGR